MSLVYERNSESDIYALCIFVQEQPLSIGDLFTPPLIFLIYCLK
jgi:hypothetical protein